MFRKDIINRIENNVISSNYVYPSFWELTEGFINAGIIDKNYVKDFLQLKFGVDRIANKYVIKYNENVYWYQADNNTWALVMKEH